VHYALEGNFKEANHFQHKLLDGIDLLFAENNPAGVKAFLAEMGLIENVLRLPLVPLSAPIQEKVRAFVNR
jgi:4-hydroxy-tetrahydrodipicolinate synthase